MRRLFSTIVLLGLCIPAALAQTRSYSDNASKTFIVGLDSYFYGSDGSLDFKAGTLSCEARVEGGNVSLNGTLLESGSADTVVGIHDLTGNGVPEVVVARKADGAVLATVYTLSSGGWSSVGRVGAKGAKEIRVFRQVLSVRSGEVLYSWTWHGSGFDFKASDGSGDPTPAL